jgi:dienelactone hydrolase
MVSADFDYQDGEYALEGYLALPPEASMERRPCVVIGHAWAGLTSAMKQTADEIAELGYVAFAMDVYGKGVRGREDGDNNHLMGPMLADRRMLRSRLLAGFSAAASLEQVDATRIVALGYCFGGLCALDLARANPVGLRGAISVHGVLTPPDLGHQAPIQASVLVLHGWEDPMAPTPAVTGLASEMTAADADWQIHAYGKAMHAFTNPEANSPETGIAYEPKAARRAWRTIVSFLAEVTEEA